MKILVLGDFFPRYQLKEKLLQYSPSEIFRDFSKIVRNSDLSIVNLEGPVTQSNFPIEKTGPALKMKREYAHFLKQAGFDLVTLANNHILDYGETGLSDTIEVLNEIGLKTVGASNNFINAQKPFFYQDSNGETLAVLNIADNEWSITKNGKPGAAGFDIVNNYYSIIEAKKSADYLLLVTHGGQENYHLPTKRFREQLRFYVDIGADAVINHHTHCISGSEIYKGKPIYYSLGNFLFDNQNIKVGSDWNKGLAVQIEFLKGGITAKNYFFEQSTRKNIFKLLESGDLSKEIQRFNELSSIILDDSLLDENYLKWQNKNILYYRINIEPHSIKIIQILQNRNILPSLWSRRKKMYLLNMLKCDSHREMLIDILENEISNTQ